MGRRIAKEVGEGEKFYLERGVAADYGDDLKELGLQINKSIRDFEEKNNTRINSLVRKECSYLMPIERVEKVYFGLPDSY